MQHGCRAGEIYVMKRDGTAVKRLTESRGWDGAPAWSPDGKAIYFQNMQAAYGLAPQRCAAFVYATEADLDQEDVREGLRLMDDIGTVIDVSEPDLATKKLVSLVT